MYIYYNMALMTACGGVAQWQSILSEADFHEVVCSSFSEADFHEVVCAVRSARDRAQIRVLMPPSDCIFCLTFFFLPSEFTTS